MPLAFEMISEQKRDETKPTCPLTASESNFWSEPCLTPLIFSMSCVAQALERCDIDAIDADGPEFQELFERYVSRGRPVLIRGLADEKRWPDAHRTLSPLRAASHQIDSRWERDVYRRFGGLTLNLIYL